MRNTIKNNALTRIFNLIVTFLLISTLASCGGGGGSTPDADPTGYYTGGATVKDTDGTSDLSLTDLRGMINGNWVMIMSPTQAILYDATITSISGNDFTADVTIYYGMDAGSTTPPPAPISTTLSGAITEGSQITGTIAGTGIGTGTFSLTYSFTNSDIANLANIAKTWTGAINNVPQLSSVFKFNIAGDGTVTVGFVDAADKGIFKGCEMTGTVSPIANTTIYSVNVTMKTNSCPETKYETDYTGFATTSDTNHNTLVIQFSNGIVAFLAELTPAP